ncbi:unnamed protein product [Linum tenue]|uniref:Uncharacterized protein n=1 Tax=Linum tenue TaxID=586396 RepID=A0AAV0NUL0_9ROSI|nr:unnamed protein product [Linum tenue]
MPDRGATKAANFVLEEKVLTELEAEMKMADQEDSPKMRVARTQRSAPFGGTVVGSGKPAMRLEPPEDELKRRLPEKGSKMKEGGDCVSPLVSSRSATLGQSTHQQELLHLGRDVVLFAGSPLGRDFQAVLLDGKERVSREPAFAGLVQEWLNQQGQSSLR